MLACLSSRVRTRALSKIPRADVTAEGFPKNVRMANLACIGSRKVNGVAEVRSVIKQLGLFLKAFSSSIAS